MGESCNFESYAFVPINNNNITKIKQNYQTKKLRIMFPAQNMLGLLQQIMCYGLSFVRCMPYYIRHRYMSSNIGDILVFLCKFLKWSNWPANVCEVAKKNGAHISRHCCNSQDTLLPNISYLYLTTAIMCHTYWLTRGYIFKISSLEMGLNIHGVYTYNFPIGLSLSRSTLG